MVVVAVVGIGLLLAGMISLFLLEIVVAGLFAAFWMVQTVEQGSVPKRGSVERAPAAAR